VKRTFVETRVFTARMKGRMTDEELRGLQNELLAEPEKGDLIRGCGGLRKIRSGATARGKGKRGGIRVIYLNIPEAERIDLLTVYGKDEKDDLSAAEKRVLRKLVAELRAKAIAAFGRGSKQK
jgi:hypothetical protein